MQDQGDLIWLVALENIVSFATLFYSLSLHVLFVLLKIYFYSILLC